MILFAAIIRTGLFAEGHFLGKVLDEWVVDAQEFLHTKLPHLLTIAIIALILSRIIALATRRMVTLAERKPSTPGHRSQVKTMAGVLRTTLKAVLWTLTVLQMLTVLGVNLGPLLASAGVAGIAIGLAAQTIVKDILNGTLILLEDQFNVGDTVRLTGMTGTVEAMSLRRTEIRDGDGTLYVVPNSQITTVANLSRDYTLATVNVSVDISASNPSPPRSRQTPSSADSSSPTPKFPASTPSRALRSSIRCSSAPCPPGNTPPSASSAAACASPWKPRE